MDSSRGGASSAAASAIRADGTKFARQLEHAVEARTAELRSAIAELEIVRGRLERAQAVANFADAEIDLDTGECVVSPEFYRLLGFDPAQGVPNLEQLFGRVQPNDLPRVRHVLSEGAAGRGWPAEDTQLIRPDGSLRWIRSVGEASHHPNSGHRTINVVLFDVTALKAAERELVANLQRERELVQLRAEFMNMVTHEYRTPLGIIMSSVEILQRYFERLSASERAAHLTEIGRGTRRLAALVEDVLFLGKADAGRVAIEVRPVAVRAVLDKICADVSTALGAERSIRLVLDRRAARAQMDLRLVSHIFSNVLGNALKYSKLETAVEVRVSRPGSDLVLEVRDHGIGIPAADIPKLFQFFQRASNVGTISGSGLGLAIVKRCVDLHGGRVSLESELGRGTCVTIHLPQSSPRHPASDENASNPRRGRRTPHAEKPGDDPENGRVRSRRGRRRG